MVGRGIDYSSDGMTNDNQWAVGVSETEQTRLLSPLRLAFGGLGVIAIGAGPVYRRRRADNEDESSDTTA